MFHQRAEIRSLVQDAEVTNWEAGRRTEGRLSRPEKLTNDGPLITGNYARWIKPNERITPPAEAELLLCVSRTALSRDFRNYPRRELTDIRLKHRLIPNNPHCILMHLVLRSMNTSEFPQHWVVIVNDPGYEPRFREVGAQPARAGQVAQKVYFGEYFETSLINEPSCHV